MIAGSNGCRPYSGRSRRPEMLCQIKLRTTRLTVRTDGCACECD
jgi:hypothetical protein